MHTRIKVRQEALRNWFVEQDEDECGVYWAVIHYVGGEDTDYEHYSDYEDERTAKAMAHWLNTKPDPEVYTWYRDWQG